MNKFNRKIPLGDKERISSLYKDLQSLDKVAKIYNVTKQGIRQYLLRHDIPIRIQGRHPSTYTTINENIFSKLDEESEYWLGFLFADGSIHLKKSAKTISKSFSCGLMKDDRAHINKCLKFLETDHRPKTRKSIAKFDPSKYGRTADVYFIESESIGFEINNYKIVDDLIGYGFTPRKSWDGCITDQRLLNSRHFWRGMIDGDGSIGYRKRDGYPLLSLVGTKIMIDRFRYFIYNEILNNSIRWTKTVKKTGTIACGVNLESDDAYRVIDYLYSKSKISLDRKKEKAVDILKNWKPTNFRLGQEEFSKIADLLIQKYYHKNIMAELNVSDTSINKVKISLQLVKPRKKELLIDSEPIIFASLHYEKNKHINNLSSLRRWQHINVVVTCKNGHEKNRRLDGIKVNKKTSDISCIDCYKLLI